MAHKKNKYLYRSFLITILIVISLNSIGCSVNKEKDSVPPAKQDNVQQTTSGTDSILTVNDIDEGIKFVNNYLSAYKEGDMEKLKAIYFPDYYPEKTNDYFKSKKNITIKRISYPTVYLNGYDVENKYKDRYKADLYKSLTLHAQYEENGEYTENDFILIKLKPDSQWVLYDMGK